VLRVHEAFAHAPGELTEERIEEPVHVHDHDRLEVNAEPFQRDGFEELFERPAMSAPSLRAASWYKGSQLRLEAQ